MVKQKTTKSKAGAAKSKRVNAAIKKLYSKSAPLLVFESILFVLSAILIFFNPVAILATVTFVVGIALIVFGIYQTSVGFFGETETTSDRVFNVLFGLVSIILGVIFCMQPVGSMITVVYIFALLFLFKSVRSLMFSIKMAKYKIGNYVWDIIMSVILIGLALLIMFFPLAGAFTVMYYLALVLLLYAASDVYMYMELRKLKKLAS